MSTDRPRASSIVSIEALEPRALLAAGTLLTHTDVEAILAHAASQARNRQAIVVSDRDGDILGILAVGSATSLTINKAVTRARTGAFFESRGEAFTTRTARFIIQDHFPHPVSNTPGGPLYGVEFSSLPGSDVFSGPAVSGDPGGIPLFKDGEPVGGIGVAGDGNDVAVREDLLTNVDNPTHAFYNGVEESDFDEQVALAGAQGFMAAKEIRADQIFLDGLRLPFTKDKPATAKPDRTFSDLISSGEASLKRAGFVIGPLVHGSAGSPFPAVAANVYGIAGFNKNTNPGATNFGVISSNDPGAEHLTFKDVNRIIKNAVSQALVTRGGIRQPIGAPMKVHIAVVDRDGDLLGAFQMDDGTVFSYDVAVQKARTAAFFSDDTHAFSTRAIGFMSQRFFPAGIDGGFIGPLFGLQNQLSTAANLKKPLQNGITIFPGGLPLYKNGVFVGAIGISGDGVDQDDLAGFGGTKGFRPPNNIRSDALSEQNTLTFISSRVETLFSDFEISPRFADKVRGRLLKGLDDVQLPYVKFPRNPEI
ncbi:MAG TPA: heme-binding protein [Tepidisphaeraceae bacterium]|jgi:uncharacterized protein GlcG (DUF336 family)